ncbi:hypothetical protein EJ110_NYTH39156 [Nymphaea thermarum]|nr:hypothetical protein EJ110_NYTH39156 [Nymphaea thermarum]
MWVILEHMYGQKKRKVRVYQLMRNVYSLCQGTRSVADFYAALKSKWEDLDYHSDLTWKSQILNSDESFSIEDVYARVEAEEQRKLGSSDRKGEEQTAFVSRASVGSSRSSRKCTHCKKLGHTVDFCWDLHPEKKNGRGKPSSSKQPVSSATDHGDRKASFSAEQIRELRAYLSQVDGETPHVQVLDKDEEGISTEAHEQEKKEEEVSPMVTEQEGTRMFGQVYSRRKTCADKVVDNEEATLNPNPTSSLDDPSHAQKQMVGRDLCLTEQEKEDLPIALRKGVSKSEGSTDYKMAGNSFSYGTTMKLNGSNYEIWSRVFIMSVAGHRKKYILAWDEDNYIVMSWIMNSVESHIAPTIAYYTKAKDMWSFLRKTYSHATNVIKILQLEEELCNIRQGDQDLSQYFATLTAAYEQLKALRPPCQHCYASHVETGMVAKFLSGLSSEYSVAKSQILTGSELPDLADTYNRLSRFAATLSQTTHDTPISALVISGGRGPSSFGGTRGRGLMFPLDVAEVESPQAEISLLLFARASDSAPYILYLILSPLLI